MHKNWTLLLHVPDSGLSPAPALIPASLSKPVELGGVTYRVVEKRLDWTGALHLCESLNGTLATVKNPYQQAYLTLLINSLRQPAWIGLYNYGVSLLTYSISYYNINRVTHVQQCFPCRGKLQWLATLIKNNNNNNVFRDEASPGWVKKKFGIQTGEMGSPIRQLDADAWPLLASGLWLPVMLNWRLLSVRLVVCAK